MRLVELFKAYECEKKAEQEKSAEEQAFGKIMAHSFMDELNKVALASGMLMRGMAMASRAGKSLIKNPSVQKATGWVNKNPGKAVAGVAAASTGLNLAQGKGLRQSLTSSPLAPNYEESK